MLRADAKVRSLRVFFLIAFSISWGGILATTWSSGIPGRGAALDDLLIPVFGFMLAGPFLAAVGLSFAEHGGAGLVLLFRGFTIWRIGWANLILASCLIPAAGLVVLLPLSRIAPAFTPGFLAEGGGPWMLAGSLAGGLVVGLIEETGWTGYATPRLLARHRVLTAAILLGVLHGVWHFMSNLWFSGEQFGWAFLPIFVTAWGLALVNMRILAVRLFKRTGGSTLAAAVVHGSHSGGLLALWPVVTSPGQDLAWTAGFTIVGSVALWIAIRRGWI